MSKPDKMVFDVAPDGETVGMHFDCFPLKFLGDMTVKRASEILFDEVRQDWYIEVYGYADDCKMHINGFTGYDIAREFEVKYVQRCRELGLDPTHPSANVVLRELGR